MHTEAKTQAQGASQLRFQLSCDAATQVNRRGLQKPNEDYYIADPEQGIFLILDGVTRPHGEYPAVTESHALAVSKRFAEVVYGQVVQGHHKIRTNKQAKAVLAEAFAAGNRAILQYNQSLSLEAGSFPPGTVAFLGVIVGARLHYAFIGDCLGLLLRDGQRIQLGEQQTKPAFLAGKTDKAELYGSICNNPEHPLGYGVLTGDVRAEQFVRCSCIQLENQDVLLLSTDGMDNYLRYAPCQELCSLSAKELLLASGQYDVPPYAKYADDKTVLKICISRQKAPHA